jgi:hypothetical protein
VLRGTQEEDATVVKVHMVDASEFQKLIDEVDGYEGWLDGVDWRGFGPL